MLKNAYSDCLTESLHLVLNRYRNLFNHDEINKLELLVSTKVSEFGRILFSRLMCRRKRWVKGQTLTGYLKYVDERYRNEESVQELDEQSEMIPIDTDENIKRITEIVEELNTLNILHKIDETMDFTTSWTAMCDCFTNDELEAFLKQISQKKTNSGKRTRNETFIELFNIISTQKTIFGIPMQNQLPKMLHTILKSYSIPFLVGLSPEYLLLYRRVQRLVQITCTNSIQSIPTSIFHPVDFNAPLLVAFKKIKYPSYSLSTDGKIFQTQNDFLRWEWSTELRIICQEMHEMISELEYNRLKNAELSSSTSRKGSNSHLKYIYLLIRAYYTIIGCYEVCGGEIGLSVERMKRQLNCKASETVDIMETIHAHYNDILHGDAMWKDNQLTVARYSIDMTLWKGLSHSRAMKRAYSMIQRFNQDRSKVTNNQSNPTNPMNEKENIPILPFDSFINAFKCTRDLCYQTAVRCSIFLYKATVLMDLSSHNPTHMVPSIKDEASDINNESVDASDFLVRFHAGSQLGHICTEKAAQHETNQYQEYKEAIFLYEFLLLCPYLSHRRGSWYQRICLNYEHLHLPWYALRTAYRGLFDPIVTMTDKSVMIQRIKLLTKSKNFQTLFKPLKPMKSLGGLSKKKPSIVINDNESFDAHTFHYLLYYLHHRIHLTSCSKMSLDNARCETTEGPIDCDSDFQKLNHFEGLDANRNDLIRNYLLQRCPSKYTNPSTSVSVDPVEAKMIESVEVKNKISFSGLKGWTCHRCTFQNEEMKRTTCQMCGSIRPTVFDPLDQPIRKWHGIEVIIDDDDDTPSKDQKKRKVISLIDDDDDDCELSHQSRKSSSDSMNIPLENCTKSMKEDPVTQPICQLIFQRCSMPVYTFYFSLNLVQEFDNFCKQVNNGSSSNCHSQDVVSNPLVEDGGMSHQLFQFILNDPLLQHPETILNIDNMFPTPSCMVLYGRRFGDPSRKGKSQFIGDGDEMVTVEQYVIQHFFHMDDEMELDEIDKNCTVKTVNNLSYKDLISTGGWQGWHCEGSPLRSIYALLFWDIIFAPHPSAVFVTAYQERPLDMMYPSFFTIRKAMILQKVSELRSSKVEDIVIQLGQSYRSHHTERCVGVYWNIPLNILQLIVLCIGNMGLSALCLALATNYKQFSSGLPDLLLVRVHARPSNDGDSRWIDISQVLMNDSWSTLSFPLGTTVDEDKKIHDILENSVDIHSACQDIQFPSVDDSNRRIAVEEVMMHYKFEVLFVEVKGPTDHLSPKQRRWLEILSEYNPSFVCQIEEKKMKNIE